MRNSPMAKLSGFGITLAIFGIMSMVLYSFDMNLKILMWIDEWGESTGWAIRIGLVVLGGIVAIVPRFMVRE